DALPHRTLVARRPADRQPGGPRAARRDRQLVRATAGQALRRGPRRLRDGLELRDPLRQRAHPDRVAAHPPGREGERPRLDPALRAGPRDHAQRRRRGGRGGRRPHRPQHGLPRPQGHEDRRGRGAALGPRHRRGGRARRPRGLRPARDREAARLAQAGAARGRRRRAAARRGGGRRRAHLPPALGRRAAQGDAGLRPRRRARRLAARPGDRVGGHARGRAHPLGLRPHGLRGGHARPRRPGQPVALRAGARHARRRAGARGDPRRVELGARAGRRAPRPGPRGALPAQVPPVVRRAPRRAEGHAGRPPASGHAGRAARPHPVAENPSTGL
ncbi:MAG: tRNA-dihydrouridine synthase DusB, partial [uncultured Solirubrobacteraceae bacterium]